MPETERTAKSDNNPVYRVMSCLGGRYLLDPEAGGERIVCRARGHLRRGDTRLPEDRVVVGDRVTIEDVSSAEQSASSGASAAGGSAMEGSAAEGSAVIGAVLPRKNVLIRPLLANLDVLIAVTATRSPDPMPELLDKLLAICSYTGIEAAVVITKTDLTAPGDMATAYRLAGYPVFCLSTQTGEGVGDAAAYLTSQLQLGKTVSFAGASGVGKSTLVNALYPSLARETGAISDRTLRGRHTTREVCLFPVFGGYIADTPGFSLLDFLHFDFFPSEALPDTFPEIAALAHECRYTDCSHTAEADCAVRRAVDEGRIAHSRYHSYCRLFEVLREKKRNAYK